jgi:chorismate dehydratase
MKIAQINYANTVPFFHFWPAGEFELHPGVPTELAEAAKRGDVIAGPLPLVECLKLENTFEPLGDWGIAAREACRSVFVLSRHPFSELDHVTIGVTRESATSVVLCKTLIERKYGNNVTLRPGLNLEDAAWLVIGDQALQLSSNPTLRAWSVVTDLATEWWDWKHQPFVFARWIVRRDLNSSIKKNLLACVDASFQKGMANLPRLATTTGERLKISPEFLKSYFNGFLYRLDAAAEESILAFRAMVEEGAYHVERATALN